MRLAQWLFPRPWTHRDAAIRLHAVRTANAAALGVELPRLARVDPDPGVRRAALERMHDLGLAQERAHDDSDPALRELAWRLYLDLLSGRHNEAPPMAARLRLLTAIDDIAVLERVARDGVESELRAAALARCTRAAFLAERALQDSDVSLRLAALARIEDPDQLQRVAERARRQDRRVQHAALERLQTLRLQAGDPVLHARRALEACLMLERAAVVAASVPAVLDTATSAWESVDDAARLPLLERYRRARGVLMATLPEVRAERECLRALGQRLDALHAATTSAEIDALLHDSHAVLATPGQLEIERESLAARLTALTCRVAADAAILVMREPEPVHPSATVPPPSPDVQALAAQARFESQRATGCAQATGATPAEATTPAPIAADGEALAAVLEAALADGDSQRIATSRSIVMQHVQNGRLPRLPARLRHALAEAGRHAHWQQWAQRQQREALYREAAALIGSGLHPDALATRITELRARWHALDASDGTLDASASAMRQQFARRFHGLCTRALAPARGYFEQRDALRRMRAMEIERQLASVPPQAVTSLDVQATRARRHQLTAALRDLAALDPAMRPALAKQLKSALAAVDAQRAALAEHAAQSWAALRAEVEATAALEDAVLAASRVRALLARRRKLPRTARDNVDAARIEAAAALVFARAEAVSAEQALAADQRQADAERLLAALTALDPTDAAAAARRRVLQRDWAALGAIGSLMQQRWRDADQGWQRRAASASAMARWDAWAARLAEVHDGAAAEPGGDVQLTLHVVEIEELAGLSSPAEDAIHREALRLQRLRAALSEGRRESDDERLWRLLDTWSVKGKASDATQRSRFVRAFSLLHDRARQT